METHLYQTSNLHIAAYLYASGVPFLGITEFESRALFDFQDSEQAEKLVGLYYTGEASVDPRELFARLNDLKDLIFSGGRHE